MNNEDLLSSVIAILNDINKLNNPVWVCVGSRVTNTNKKTSDIDLLAFDDGLSRFEREKNVVHGVEVSVCKVPRSMLLSDSYQGTHGGYFAAKLFHPHKIVGNKNEDLVRDISAASSRYFAPFIMFEVNQKKRAFTYEQLTAIALSYFLTICPDYDSYWLRNVHTTKEWWDNSVSQFAKSIKKSGLDFSQGSKINEEQFPVLYTKDALHREIIDRAIRHWSFGTISHNGSLHYYDWYQKKARDVIDEYGGYEGEKYLDMINFIERLSGRKMS